jgi:glutamyl-tRNA synthetase
MSKRHGATSVQAFRDMGIVPEAMVNYLARLGWSHGDQEIFSRTELIALFDIKNVGASGAVFDQAKLEWLSQEYLKAADGPTLARLAAPFLARAGLPVPADEEWLGRALSTLKERAKTLVELADKSRIYFERPSTYDPKAAQKFLTRQGAARLRKLLARLEVLVDFTPAGVEAVYRELTAALGLKLVDLAQLSRVALTGTTVSPPIFEVIALLGRQEAVARLRAALALAERGPEATA